MVDASDSKGSAGKTGDVLTSGNRWQKVVEKVLEEERRRSWNDFTQATTLHGLKYIFEPTFPIRRVLWLLAVLSAMTLFTLQVLSRGSDYFRYETNVDVQVVYRGEVTFPAVTFCNQNSFRLTALADLGLYNFIDAVYSADNVTDIDLSMYNLDGLETDALLRQVAHQKVDLIVSCYWKGQPCDIEADFQERLTGLGVCYTFNAGSNGSVLVADEPGSRDGLSLVLNLEQYEYTKGPQSDAGVKILLHGQSEYPLMEDMGFAAAPGTHTLVGVSAAKVKYLPAPYGTCNNEGVPMSDCLRDCRTKQVMDKCGCRAPHMKTLVEAPSKSCNVEEFFTCVLYTGGANMSRNGTNKLCDCSLPCERIQYASALSYAKLSHFNIERVVLKNPKQEYLIWQKQLMARETFQRVDGKTVAKDKMEHANQVTYVQELMTLAENMSILFSEEVQLLMLKNISDTLNSDLGTLRDEFVRRWWVLNNLWIETFINYGPVVKPVNFTTDLLRYFSVNNLTESLTACLNINNQSGNATWCDQLVHDTYNALQYIRQQGMSVYAQFKAAYTSYADTMNDIYKDTPVNPTSVIEHQQCLSAFDVAVNGVANDVLSETLKAIEKVVNTTNSVDYTNEVLAVNDLVRSKRYKDAMLDYKEVARRYFWFGGYSGDWTNEFYAANNVLQFESNRLNFLITILTERVLPRLSHVEKVLFGSVSTILEKSLQYMEGNLFKLELCNELRHATLRGTADVLEISIAELLEHAKAVVSDLDLIEIQLHRGFRDMFKLRLPVVSNQVFTNSKLLNWSHSLELPGVSSLIDSLHTMENKTEIIMAIVSNVIDALRKPVENLNEEIFDKAGNLVDTINQQQSRLQQFAEDVTPSDAFYMSNFMKVDIYYEELKIDQIRQFPAFQALSLFGEIGGFLGLLLGASVLTLVELFDFIFMTFVHKLCRKRNGNPPKDPRF